MTPVPSDLSPTLPSAPSAPVGKKKRALMPSTPLRRRLRAHGHALHPLVRIGKDGISAGLLKEIAKVLFDHELCKVKLEAECPLDRFAVAERLGEQPGTDVVQILGRTVLVYKRHPQDPRFEGPRSRPAAPEDAVPPRPRRRRPARKAPARKAAARTAPARKAPLRQAAGASRRSR
jgi:RNA-binding protein